MGENRDKLMAYLKGWSDGAGVKAIRPEFETHATLSGEYSQGYEDGRKARSVAHLAAADRLGEKIGIVRVPEPILSTDVAMVAFDVSSKSR